MARVYVSSTYLDLRECREQVRLTLRRLGHEDVAMEYYIAEDQRPVNKCLADVAACDLYLGIFAWRYGWVPKENNSEGLSITEMEYRQAVEEGKTCLIFLLDGKAPWPPDSTDRDRTRIEKLREESSERHGGMRFTSAENLAVQLGATLQKWQEDSRRGKEAETFAKYLDYLIERNTYVDPRGIMQTVRSVSLKLDEVHVLLTAEREVIKDQMLDKRMLRLRAGLAVDEVIDVSELDVGSPFARSLMEPRTERVDLAQAVREHARIVVLGDPGAGKTTLMRFLALQFALSVRDAAPGVRDKEGHEYGEARMPILVRIAEYADAFAKNHHLRLREFLPHLFGNIEAPTEEIAKVLHQALSRGQALVLLDGLDEIIDSGDRAQIARQIEDFVAGADPRNRFVVTSRIAGYRSAALGGEFVHFTLRDLEREQIEKFLKRWCMAVERFHMPDAPEAEITRRAQREIDGILNSVDENVGVERLAANPLMLTILALIHRQGARLPRRRVDLYELATKTLLEDWRLAQVPAAKVVRENEALRLLGPLAYWMHANKPSGLAHEREVKDKLAEALAVTRNLAPDDPNVQDAVDDFLQRVREHTGIFVERAPRQFGFMHLTFEEYFAARELVRRRKEAATRIYQCRHQPRWEEPILLAIGFVSHAYPDEAGELIRTAILAEGEEAAEEGFKPSLYEDVLHRDLLLAAKCIGDCAEVEVGLRQQVVKNLVDLYLEDKGAGKYVPLRERVIASLEYFVGSEAGGDAANFLLAALRDESAAVRSNAAGALGKIGTPEAVQALVNALRDENADVRRYAAGALGKIGTLEAVQALVSASRDENVVVRRIAAWALGMMKAGTPEAVQVLVSALRDESAAVRVTAARALGAMKAGTPEVVQVLVRALRDESADMRSNVARALGNIGAPEAMRALVSVLRDKKAAVQRNAAWALGGMKEGTLEAVQALVNALRDESTAVRRTAARALGGMKGGTPEVVKALVSALRDENADVRRNAVWALGKIGAPEAVQELIGALRDENADVRSNCDHKG